MHMGYSLTDLIGDVVQMSYVDYSDKGSVLTRACFQPNQNKPYP